jgi:cobaltochelatase CobN
MRQLARRLALLALLLVMAAPASAAPVRVAFLYSDGNMAGTLGAYRTLLAERPDLRGQVSLTFLTESVFDQVSPTEMAAANVLVFDTMNEQMLTRFNAAHHLDLLAAVRARGTVFGVGEGLVPKDTYLEQGVVWDQRARAYWTHSGPANQLALLKYVLTRAGIGGLSVGEPQLSIESGYYYPDGGAGQVFAQWDDFERWRRAHGRVRPGAPRVGIGFYKATYYTGDKELLDALVAEVERQGAEAVPYFGYPGAVASEQLLRDAQGQRRVDVALSFLFNFADAQAWQSLARIDVPVINLVSLYGRSEQEWRSATSGISSFEGTFQMAVPELAGTIAPTVVGSRERRRDPDTGLTVVVTHPIASRVRMAVSRGLHYAALRLKPNRDKHVALVYYNYPPGKASIGASYLNVAESIAAVLRRMAADGYDVGSADLSAEQVLRDMTAKGRNVGGYAPGELQALEAEGSAVRVTLADYRRWLDAYPAALRAKILKDWGPPEQSRLMTSASGGFIVPAIRYGNVVLMPQPSRGWGEDTEKMYHATDLAPHHQYVAAYGWLRHAFAADAVIHVGTHGTLEWLDGKDAGLTDDDAPDALMADLPDLYIYNVDVVGEGLVARRRGMATLIDHMVPPFTKGGLYAELAGLAETISDYEGNRGKNPELAAAIGERIRAQVQSLGIANDLHLDLTRPGPLDDEALHRVENHLLELKGQNIPYGLHAFGRTPAPPLRQSTIDAVVSADRSLLPEQATVLASDMEARITESGPRELTSLMRALSGGFVPAGTGGEPIRNPDAYATGRNFYGVDPDKIPKRASWDLGVKLADQMLADHVKAHGRYPEKVSFVIWGDETMRHEGVLESQIFYLLGTRPIWNSRDKVVGVDVIPSRELGRPRVDIVIASAAEGMFHNVTLLMDQAVQKVKAIEEAENVVRRHYLQTKATLIQKGYSEADADARAGVRIFDEPPGQFNLNTSTIAAASGTWDSDAGMADDYIAKMGHGYGNGFWGESMADVFRLALAGTEQVVHSSSTSLYGALDNDDMFMYMGGLAAAVRSVDGSNPELVVTNTRDPGHPQMTPMRTFLGTEFRSRYVNPTWIEGMKKEGYAGAGAMREFVEYLWGWNATVPELVDAGLWQDTFDTYVKDARHLELKAFFEEQSPYAYQDMTGRMVETIRKGYWKADAETRAALLREYVESVNAHGSSGAGFTTGNPRLTKYVLEQGKIVGIPAASLARFQSTMEQATGSTVAAGARAAERFVSRNEVRPATSAPDSAPAPDAVQAPKPAAGSARARGEASTLTGFLMEQRERVKAAATAATRAPASAPGDDAGVLLVSAPLVLWLLAWRARARRRATSAAAR